MAVRREKVVLELEDAGFSTQMLRNAVATTTLERALKSLDGTNVRIDQRINNNTRQLDTLSTSAVRGSNSINQLTGRLEALAKAALVLGPSLIPIGAVGIPAITGLASQLGFAAIGAGSLIVAAQGVGDALKAANEAAIEPTAENLEKAREAMRALGPEAQTFVARFQELRPVLGDLRDAAASGWFPGLTDSLDELEAIAPRVASILESIGETGGNLLADGAAALAGPEWAQFIAFIENNGPEALDELGRSVGNLALGLAELWMAFDPLNDDFSSWLLNASRDFAAWADGLAETQGFEDFVDYIRKSGPQVERTLGAIAEATISIIKAASPLGGPVLAAFEVVADTLKLIADSPAGSKIFTMAAAFVVLNKTLAITAGLMTRLGFAGAAGALGGARSGGPAPGGAGGSGVLPIGQRIQATRASFAQLRTDMAALQNKTGAAIRASRDLSAAQARVNATTRSYAATVAKAGTGVAAFAVATGAAGKGLGLQNTAMLGLVGSMATAGPWGAAIGASIGLVADFTSANNRLEDALRAAGDALESMDPQELVNALAMVNQQVDKFADWSETDNFSDFIGDYATMERQASIVNEIGASLGLWESETEKVAEEQRKLEDAVSQAERATSSMNLAQQRLASDERIKEWARSSGEAFLDLSSDIDKPTDSLSDLLNRMRDQGEAALAMGRNLREAIRNGADPTALQKLIDDLGPQAGLALQQLAEGGRDAATKLNRSWAIAVGGAGNLERAVSRVGREIMQLPDGTEIKITADTLRARSELQRIEREAKAVAGDYRINYIVTQTRRNIIQNLPGGRDGDPATPYDAGGYTGRGGKYEPAGIVHRGEVVIPQELVARDRDLLKGRYGNLPGMEQLYTGGLAGYASGGRVGALDFADLPALNLSALSLAKLNKALGESTKALEKEKDQRSAVVDSMVSLRSDVAGKLRSDLFAESDPWASADTGFSGAMSILSGDISAARDFKADVAALKAKGFDGAALDDLLRNGDAAVIDSFANQSKSALAKFESAYNVRQSLTASAGSAAGQAAYGAELARQTAEMKLVASRVARVESAIRAEHKEDRRSTKRGAGSGARNRRRG